MIFNVNALDAQHLIRGLRGLVEVDDLIALEVGQAVARIGTHVVRLRTLDPLKAPEVNYRDLIVQRCRERYCRPMREVQRAIRRRGERWAAPRRPYDSLGPLDARPMAGSQAGPPSSDGRDDDAHPPELNDYDRW
jgi:hypothetical protein